MSLISFLNLVLWEMCGLDLFHDDCVGVFSAIVVVVSLDE
jgi:hypothetical protein